MNKQIAIDILEKEKAYMQQHAGKAQVEAFDMAICALKISEQEIRDKAIEEFSSLLANKDNIVRYDVDEILSESGNFDYASDCFRKYIDKIAEQMKEVGE